MSRFGGIPLETTTVANRFGGVPLVEPKEPSSTPEVTPTESPLEEVVSPELSKDMQAADAEVKATKFTDVASKRTPETSSEFWGSLFPLEPNTKYATLLPLKKDETTGKVSPSITPWLRPITQGIASNYKVAEEAAKGAPIEQAMEENLTPEGALLPLGFGPTSVASRIKGAKAAIEASVDKSTSPILDTKLTDATRAIEKINLQEAKETSLLQLRLAAQSPSKLSDEQIATRLNQVTPAKSIEELDAEIKALAADTATPGNKEKLAELQKQKEQLVNPPTRLMGTELDDDMIDNLAYTVQNSLDSGANIKEAEEALRSGLSVAYRKTPEKVDQTVERLLLPFKEANPITAPLPTLPPKEAAQMTTAVNKATRSRTDKFVTEEEIDAALKGHIMKASLNYNNDLAPFYSISRIFSKKNGDKFGSGDNLTGDKYLSLIKNSRFQHDNAIIPNLIGPEDGSANFIVKMTKNGVTEDDFTIKPLMTIQKEARDAGLSAEQLDEFRLAANALDDYTNIKRDIASVNTRISSLKTALSKEKSPEKKVEIKADLRIAQRELKELSSQDTYTRYKDREGNFVALPRQRVEEIIRGLEENPAGKQYLEDLKKWSQHLIDIRVEAGLLSKAEADALKKSHPYYLSAKREIDDYGFDDLRSFTTTGSANKGLKTRGISATDYNASPVENTVANMQGAVRAAQRNNERQLMLDFFIEKLDPAAWKKVFREDMEDVMYAIQRAKFDPDAPKVIEASKITRADPLQKTGNFQVFYNGKRIDLTIIDPSMLRSMTRPSTYLNDNNHPLIKAAKGGIIDLAQIKRNLITTYNPVFNVTSLVREGFGYALTADQRVIGRANLYKFWKSYGILNDFRKDPTFYKRLKENVSPGVLARDYQNVKGTQLVKDVAESKLFYDERGAVSKAKKALTNNKIVASLSEFAQYSDMATRGRYYKDVKAALLKQGKSAEEADSMAMAAARDIAVNYQERGASDIFNNYKAMVPFLKTTINSMGKDMSALRYKKQQVAEVLTAMTGVSYGLLEYNKQFVDETGQPTYYQIPHHIRLNNWVIKTGDDVNDYAIIPAPFSFVGKLPTTNTEGLDMAFTAVANRIAEDHAKGTSEVVKNLPSGKLAPQDLIALNTNLLLGQFSASSFLPVGLSTAAEIRSNKDWKGATILPDFLSNVELQDQVIPGQTSKMAIAIGNAIGESPVHVQYALEANTAALGKAILSGGDMIISATEGKEKPKLELSSLPFVDRFSGVGTEADKTNAGQMYSRISKELREANDTLNKRKKDYLEGSGSKEAYLEYQDENRELIRAYKTIIEPTNKKITSLYKQMLRLQYGGYSTDRTTEKEVLGDPKLREKIDSLKNQITATREKALQQIERNKDKYGDLWQKRLQVTPQTEEILDLFQSNKPKETEKKLDKNDETSYNFLDNFSLISSANAAEPSSKVSKGMEEDTTRGLPNMIDMPPGYVSEQPVTEPNKVQTGKGFFEMKFPNLNKELNTKPKETPKSGLSSSYYSKLASVESSNNPQAKAKTSSATGLYQFTRSTWNALVEKYGKSHGLTKSGILDKKQQQVAIRLFTPDNKKALADKLDLPLTKINDTAAYAAHFLGVNGAAKLLTAPYSTPAAKLLPDAAKANKSIFYDDKGRPKSVKEVINVIETKITKG